MSAADLGPVEGGRPADGGHRAEGPDPAPAPAPGSRPATPRRRRPLAAVGAAVREVFVVVVMALALSFVVKTWLLQAFYIPSGSMEDTLLVGDRVVVSKLSPTPFDIERGDVVVFQDPGGWLDIPPPVDRSGLSGALHDGLVFVGLLPAESEDHLIKRVIGLPGDRVACCTEGQSLTVNGVALTEPYLKPGDVPSTLTFDITVPEGQVWVMGDHRSDSEDSRFHDPSGTGADGAVPIDDITGRAVAVVWPLDRAGWLSHYASTFSSVPDAASTP